MLAGGPTGVVLRPSGSGVPPSPEVASPAGFGEQTATLAEGSVNVWVAARCSGCWALSSPANLSAGLRGLLVWRPVKAGSCSSTGLSTVCCHNATATAART